MLTEQQRYHLQQITEQEPLEELVGVTAALVGAAKSALIGTVGHAVGHHAAKAVASRHHEKKLKGEAGHEHAVKLMHDVGDEHVDNIHRHGHPAVTKHEQEKSSRRASGAIGGALGAYKGHGAGKERAQAFTDAEKAHRQAYDAQTARNAWLSDKGYKTKDQKEYEPLPDDDVQSSLTHHATSMTHGELKAGAGALGVGTVRGVMSGAHAGKIKALQKLKHKDPEAFHRAYQTYKSEKGQHNS